MALDPSDPSVGLRRRFPDMHPEDWTIPPEMPTNIDPIAPPTRRETVEDGLRAARLLAAAALVITLITTAMWAWTGRPPATDPSLGIPVMLLHMGAIFLAARSLQASSTAWRRAESLDEQEQPWVDPLESMAMTLSCNAIFLVQAAMVLAAILY